MRLAAIDSRANLTKSNRRVGSDLLSIGSYEQFIIDMDRIPNKPRPTVPAWVCVVHENGDVTPAPGAFQLPDKFIICPVKQHLQLWCKAGLILARSQFGKTLEQDQVEAKASLKYWIEGGSKHGLSGIKNKLCIDDLPMRILHQWPYWQTEAFRIMVKNGRVKLWSARLETIKKAGYHRALDENRLKVTYQRMGF